MKTIEQYHEEITELLEQMRGVVDVARAASSRLEEADINPRSLHSALWRVMIDLDSTTKLVAVKQSLLLKQGIAPKHYTQSVICTNCGEVKLWQGCAKYVLGCPWCFFKRER